ncbi:MAG: UPF0182 family protein [Ruminiclostridium sp.]|nr:UPF0182 family protein [Ruminiclostridium sp.]
MLGVVYDYYQEKNRKSYKGRLILGAVIAAFLILLMTANKIYLEIIQLDEIGGFSGIYVKNLIYKAITFAVCFVLIFSLVYVSSLLIKRNMQAYFKKNDLPQRKFPNLLVAIIIAFLGALISKDIFFLKILNFMNSTAFNMADPIFSKDIGYYVFIRPLYMSVYGFISSLWIFVIAFTVVYYLVLFSSSFSTLTLENLKVKSVITHNLINIAIFFIIKTFSYQLLKQDILFGNVYGDVTGAGYVGVNVWLKYFAAAPYLLIAIVVVSLFFIRKDKLKAAALAIAVFPVVWILTIVISLFVQKLIVLPNEFDYEKEYIANNITETRKAYSLDKIKTYDFPSTQKLTAEIIQRNLDTKNNIRIVDIQSTLDSNVQLQSNTAFYSFNDGDIINYTINGKAIPVFITAREIDKNKLPDKTYLNTTYRYTHGYGLVMNPINKLTRDGQVDFILSGLVHKSVDPDLKISRPEIYYGELTEDHVIVNAKGLDEIDYDGTKTTVYKGTGGIKLNFLNKLLFSIKYSDFKMLISGYTSNSTLLLNREIISRAQKAVPFLAVDRDPYIILADDGTLKWVLDAYTTTDQYPYAQKYSDVNYIRNSVKIVIDAYDGKATFYIIDRDDPIIKTYDRIYPGIFSKEKIPDSIAKHMRYPETLFKIQTEMLNKYHILPDKVSTFYTQQDLWSIARYSPEKGSANLTPIEPYYNMIKLPGDLGKNEELVLMRPFTPAGESKHNMVSWLAVRNSTENYGEMVLFNFPKNTNIFGPNQVEVKINQIDKISTDMTLWGQSGSDVYKGNLLVIPIENSVLYVEPIYIRSAGSSSIPEVREIVVGYQNEDEFRYGIGTNLDNALADLFKGEIPAIPDVENKPGTAEKPQQPGQSTVDRQKLDEITKKYEQLKKQLDELGSLLNELLK